MTDKLKQFIEENRAAFDSEVPDAHLYKKIEQQRRGKSKTALFYRGPLRWAAVVTSVILLSASLYWLSGNQENTSREEAVPVVIEEETGITDPVYAKQIYHFRELISLKQEELKQLEKEYPQLYEQFVSDINQLDSAYTALKVNLGENPNREMLLEAMIQNLQLQSDLLNRQLFIIKEIKQKTRNHEKSTI